MNKIVKKIMTAVLAIVILVGIDQWTKSIAVTKLQSPIELIKGVFEFTYVENRGAAFGILQNHQMMFAAFTVIVVILIFAFYLKVPSNKKYLPLNISLVALMAGAIGNFVDRIYLGYVVDFLYFKLINFPVFNVADIYVTCSAFLLVILVLFVYKEEDFKFNEES